MSELAAALRLPERTAESLLGESRMLMTELPRTLAALRAGEISTGTRTAPSHPPGETAPPGREPDPPPF